MTSAFFCRDRATEAWCRKGHARRRMRESLPALYLGSDEDRSKADIVTYRLELIDLCEELSNGDVIRTQPRLQLDEKVDKLLQIGVNFGSDVQVSFYERRVSDLSNEIVGDFAMPMELCNLFTKTCLPWYSVCPDQAADASDDDRTFCVKQTTVRQLDGGPQYHRRTSEETLTTATIVKLIGLVDNSSDASIIQSLRNLAEAMCAAFTADMDEENTKLAKRILTVIRGTIHVIDIHDIDNACFYDKMFDSKANGTMTKSIAVSKCLLASTTLVTR